MTPELLNKIASYRQKAKDNTLTMDEMREAIKMLRDNRLSAGEAKTAKGPTKSAEDLLKGLDAI